MLENKRVIIGSEVNDDRKLELDKKGVQVAVPVTVYDENGDQITNFGGSGNSSFGDGNKTVTTAGTSVQLSSSSVPAKKITIQAKSANTGSIYVGSSTVSATRGIELLPTGTITLSVNNLNLIYIDASVSGEGITYIYEN